MPNAMGMDCMSVSQSTFHLSPNTRSTFAHVKRQLQAVQLANPLSLAWLVMPSSLAGCWRVQAASSLNVHILTLHRLAAALQSAVGDTPPILSPGQRVLRLSQLMAEAHAEQQLQVLPPPSRAPNLAKHVDALIQECKQAEISVEAFRLEAVRTGQAQDIDLAYLYDRYETALGVEELCDGPGMMAQVCNRAEEIWTTLGPPAYVGVVGHDRFSRLEQRLLVSVQQHVERFEIFYPAGPDPSAWDLATETAQALGLTCPAQVREANPIGNAAAVVHVEAPTPEHEVRYVLRQIKQRHIDETIPLQDFTVCLPNFTTYAPLLQACAEEYGLPLALGPSLALHPLAQTLRQLLHLAPDFPWHLSWDILESPFVRQSFFDAEDLRDLRRITQQGQVVEGPAQWQRALDWEASRAGFDRLSPERTTVLGIQLETFFAACRPPEDAHPHDCLTWIGGFVPEDGQGSLILALPDCDDLKQQMLNEGAWVQIQKTLQTLQSNRIQRTRSAWSDLRAWFWATLQEQELQLHEPSRAVQVTSFATGWRQPTTYLYALGLNEGVWPRLPAPGPWYSQQERRDSPLPLLPYDPRLAQLRWTQLVANCAGQVTVSRPTADVEMRQIAASAFWVPETAPLVLPRSLIPAVAEAASLTELTTALQEQQVPTVSEMLQRRLHRADKLAAIVAARLASWGSVGPFEGHLTHKAIHGELQRKFDLDTTWSASSLQDFARCPLGFLARHVLGLQPEPQAAVELDFRTRGSILHDILNRLLRWIRDHQIGFDEADAAEIFAKAREYVQATWESLPERYRLQPYALHRFDRRHIETLILQAVRLDLEYPEWRPFLLEWRFGDRKPEEILLRHEERDYVLPLRGIVDRVDRSAAGHLRVVDYKSRTEAYSQKDMDAALNTQAVLYALVVDQQGWGTVATSGFRMLHDTTTGKLENEIDWTQEPPPSAPAVEAALCRQQDDMRFGRFPAAPPHFAGTHDRCADWCELAAFCQPSPQSRRKAARAFSR